MRRDGTRSVRRRSPTRAPPQRQRMSGMQSGSSASVAGGSCSRARYRSSWDTAGTHSPCTSRADSTPQSNRHTALTTSVSSTIPDQRCITRPPPPPRSPNSPAARASVRGPRICSCPPSPLLKGSVGASSGRQYPDSSYPTGSGRRSCSRKPTSSYSLSESNRRRVAPIRWLCSRLLLAWGSLAPLRSRSSSALCRGDSDGRSCDR